MSCKLKTFVLFPQIINIVIIIFENLCESLYKDRHSPNCLCVCVCGGGGGGKTCYSVRVIKYNLWDAMADNTQQYFTSYVVFFRTI